MNLGQDAGLIRRGRFWRPPMIFYHLWKVSFGRRFAIRSTNTAVRYVYLPFSVTLLWSRRVRWRFFPGAALRASNFSLLAFNNSNLDAGYRAAVVVLNVQALWLNASVGGLESRFTLPFWVMLVFWQASI